ncbi:hypothetical protein NE848_04425 [Gramella jeungdoensis]|uniref:Lipocalin-like domain-containing protein n=1 Tax=Gramella jeungdoensis TaxID=708091 RepID=A0ABT0YYQ6_9FLAO|nr:hypothetical protein [Gramella jeungdoensis]MCM8568611.1 hypothetical protein [Gramella jeungdoensis]
MKLRRLILLLSILLAYSCSSNKDGLIIVDFSAGPYPQTWKLFKMTGSMVNSETAGEDMAWQEEYRFSSNASVVKTRTQDGVSSSITGDFTISQENDRQLIIIEYQEDSNLIGSCTGTEESLFFNAEDGVLNSNWWACDGPGLFYKKN